jgi:hypothetical protein
MPAPSSRFIPPGLKEDSFTIFPAQVEDGWYAERNGRRDSGPSAFLAGKREWREETKEFIIMNKDGLVKSQKSRRSREGGSPELIDFTGFPLSRE